MTDTAWRRDEPDSPCKQICLIHPDAAICIGCHRSAEEIRVWSAIGPDERSEILAALPGRASLLRKRRRGRRRVGSR